MLWYLLFNIIFQLLFDIVVQVSLPEVILNDINWYSILTDSIDTKYHKHFYTRACCYRGVPRFNFSLMTGCVHVRNRRVALTRRHNLQIFFPSAPTVPHPASSFTLLSLPSVLSLSRSPRAIHQRKSTGVLAFPFFGCSNELAVSLVTLSLLPPSHQSFRLCPPLFLSWPVNLPFSSSRSVYDWDFIADTAPACSVSQCQSIYLTYSLNKSRDYRRNC